MADRKSVQVAVRVRPLVPTEISKGCKEALDVHTSINQVRIKNSDKAFTFNHVFGPESAQDEVYEKSVKELVLNLFEGYNLTILAYGQTGSGKTHSMGTNYDGEGDMGVIPRVIQDIFEFVRNHFSLDFNITVSFMELYQEVLYDLLADKQRDQCVLDIREDPSKGIILPGLTEVPVQSAKEVYDALMRGSLGRATGSTNMNAQSSRSHAIFTMNICLQDKNDCNENKTAKLHLVDLAGSERSKKTGAVGTTFKEGVNINKGLLALGNVISILGEDKQPAFIPYRDSNLTRLLKDSLGGNSITLMIACVSPADYNLDETMSTLRYADRARKIQNKPIVNQDAKAAEINQLKKTIQELRLQIVGQGGPVTCPAEIELMKKENTSLRMKIKDLTLQLSSTLNNNTELIEKLMIMQNTNEVLSRKIAELKNEYDITLNNISTGMDQNDMDAIKLNITKLQQIHCQFTDIDNEQKRAEMEIRNHEQAVSSYNINNNQNGIEHNEMTKDQESHTHKQMELNIELQEISKKLAMKEHLAKQIATNAQYMVDYNALADNEAKILTLQKEKDELLQQLKNVRAPEQGSHRIAEQRKRVQELEHQIHELNRKVQEQARLIKLKERDEAKIRKLNSEIVLMKQHKVKLIKNMREEMERFKTFRQQRERELAKLKQQDRQKQNQIVKMEVMHSKQQNVLRRKVEEAVALNKRLKDALALRKTVQDSKNHAGKADRICGWLKQEVEVYGHIVEAEATLNMLLEDRATLQEQLDKLKNNSSSSDEDLSSEIKAIEEDIELRSVQIQDLQQKLLDSDEDNKSKLRFDNIQTMGEAKFALKTLFEHCGELKKREVLANSRMIETQASQTELTNQMSALEQRLREEESKLKEVEARHGEELAKLQEEHTEKASVLLRLLRGVQVKGEDEELLQRCNIQEERINHLDTLNQEYEAKMADMQKQIEELTNNLTLVTRLAQEQKTPFVEIKVDNAENIQSEPMNTDEVKTPVMLPKKKKIRKMNQNMTYNLSDVENTDDDDEDDLNKDPDWRKTPLGKWLIAKKNRAVASRSAMEILGAASKQNTAERQHQEEQQQKEPQLRQCKSEEETTTVPTSMMLKTKKSQHQNHGQGQPLSQLPLNIVVSTGGVSSSTSGPALPSASAGASFKRTSEGGCNCKGNCSSRCGCKKVSKSCSQQSCKCSVNVCTNRTDDTSTDQNTTDENKESLASDEDSFKKPRTCMKGQRLFVGKLDT